jgi:hypothetical protein
MMTGFGALQPSASMPISYSLQRPETTGVFINPLGENRHFQTHDGSFLMRSLGAFSVTDLLPPNLPVHSAIRPGYFNDVRLLLGEILEVQRNEIDSRRKETTLLNQQQQLITTMHAYNLSVIEKEMETKFESKLNLQLEAVRREFNNALENVGEDLKNAKTEHRKLVRSFQRVVKTTEHLVLSATTLTDVQRNQWQKDAKRAQNLMEVDADDSDQSSDTTKKRQRVE